MTVRTTATALLAIALLIVAITSTVLADARPQQIVDSDSPTVPTLQQPDSTLSRLPAGSIRPGVYAARDWRYLPGDVYPIIGGHQQYTWQQIEIRDNAFDWSAIDSWLFGMNMQSKGAGIGFITYNGRLLGGITVPAWFATAHPAAIIDCGGWQIPRYWNAEYLTYYRRFLQAAATHYNGDSRLQWLQLGIGLYGENQPSDDDGVNGYSDTTCVRNALAADFGLSPADNGALSDQWIQIVNTITDMHAAVFTKPLFTLYAPSFVRRCERLAITDHAAGIVTSTVGLFAAGLFADQNDVINPFGQTGCGKYDPMITWNQSPTRTVPTAFEMYGYMITDTTQLYWSVLNALDKHVDILNVEPDLLILYGDKYSPATDNFFAFNLANRFLGKTIADTPSVWVALREHDPVHTGDGISAGPQYGNFSFWLYQDENAPGGRTITATTSAASLRFDPVLSGREGWSTRRTDHASGNDYMYFNVDAGYPAASAIITVTYFDRGMDTWRLEFRDASGTLQLRTVTKANSGAWQKATFTISDIRLNGDFSGDDFRIYNLGDGDEYIHTVEFMRSGTVPPTPTRTSTPSQTPTGAPTVTGTATPSTTSTPTRTSTTTVTPTGAPPTATPTHTATMTPLPTGTGTATRTSTTTSTPSRTGTATATRTRTRTGTATATATPSLPGTPTNTPTPTATQTISVIPVACGNTTHVYSGNTQQTGSQRLFTYACGSVRYGNQWGPENVYQFTTSARSLITARLRPDYAPTAPGDPDLFILSQLDSAMCLPGSYGDMVATYDNAPAGTYSVAVDGWLGWSGSYTLELTCTSAPTPTPTATLPLLDPVYLPIIIVD